MQVLIEGIVETASTRQVKLSCVPLLEGIDQLLLDDVDLLLPLSILVLVALEHCEVVPIDLLQVFHLAKHDQFLLINDLLRSLLKDVLRSELFVPHSNLPLLFLPIQLALQGIDILLVSVQSLSDVLDTGALLFDLIASISNPTLEGLPFLARLKLNEGLLLVNGFSLLFDGFLELLTPHFSIFCVFTSDFAR